VNEPIVSLKEATRFWIKLGFISFGGPTGQIAIMHTELVEKKCWISESRFLHALNFCMFLPGPEATQLAIYVGWLLNRTIGGIIAGAFFVIPSIFILWALSVIYVEFGKIFWISSIFYGLKAAVTAIVAAAVLRIGRRALRNWMMWLLAGAAFVAIFFFKVSFPLIIAGAAIAGFIIGKLRPDSNKEQQNILRDASETPLHTKPSLLRSLKVILFCLALWWLPIGIVAQQLHPNHTLVREGVFFSKAAMVTFGGAYAVLPYVAQQAVEKYQWLQAPQMIDGLGLAETTPGPLIMVVQFVGFMGAWNHPGGLPPLLAATLGALIATWTTFVPCFLWIFLGAPYIEQLRGSQNLTDALSAVTAAVVGVVLNLTVWFAIHAMFPGAKTVDWFLVLLSAAGFLAMTRWKIDIVPIILISGALGLIFRIIGALSGIVT
jgi:chromate transporter